MKKAEDRAKEYQEFLNMLDFNFQTKCYNESFAFVVRNSQYLTELYWNHSTKERYAGYFNDYLLKPLSQVPMEEMTIDYCEKHLEEVQKKRARPFEYGEMNKLRYLIRLVFDRASEMGIVSKNIFWGSSIYQADPRKEEEDMKSKGENRKKELVVLRKSLSPAEEKVAFKRLIEDPLRSWQQLEENENYNGTLMGLALMYALGLRNAEACGATFGAVQEMTNYPGNYYFTVVSTTIEDTTDVKAGGKTRNAPRKLPMLDKLAELIQARRRYVEEKIKSDPRYAKKQINIDMLPIACRTDRIVEMIGGEKKESYVEYYTENNHSSELSAAGKQLLRSIGIAEEEVSFIEKRMVENEAEAEYENLKYATDMGLLEVEYKEKDPTAYLLRRNNGTHLELLGLTQTQIEAYMGHKITDVEIEKNDMENEDLLYAIKKKLDKRPFFSQTDYLETALEPEYGEQQMISPGKCVLKVKVPAGKTLKIRTVCCEQNQELTVEASIAEDVKMKCKAEYAHQPPTEIISVFNAYQKSYQQK